MSAEAAADVLRTAAAPAGRATLGKAFALSREPFVVAQVRQDTVRVTGRTGSQRNSARSTLRAVLVPTGPDSCRLAGSFRTPSAVGVLTVLFYVLALLWTLVVTVSELLRGGLDATPLLGVGLLTLGVTRVAVQTVIARAEEGIACRWLAERLAMEPGDVPPVSTRAHPRRPTGWSSST